MTHRSTANPLILKRTLATALLAAGLANAARGAKPRQYDARRGRR